MLYIAVGILGATVMPHNLYLHSSVVQTRMYADTDDGRKEAIRFATIDSTVALMSALFINAAILIVATYFTIDMARYHNGIASAMLDHHHALASETTDGFWRLFSMWTVMQIAMMSPTAVPMMLMHTKVQRTRIAENSPLLHTTVFFLGYISVWTALALSSQVCRFGCNPWHCSRLPWRAQVRGWQAAFSLRRARSNFPNLRKSASTVAARPSLSSCSVPAGEIHLLTPATDLPLESYTLADGRTPLNLQLHAHTEKTRFDERIRTFTASVPAAVLVKGGNVLAVEIHRAAVAGPQCGDRFESPSHLSVHRIRVTSATGAGVTSYEQATAGTWAGAPTPSSRCAKRLRQRCATTTEATGATGRCAGLPRATPSTLCCPSGWRSRATAWEAARRC